MFSTDLSQPHRLSHLAIGSAIAAVVLTIAFHFTIGERPYGFGFAIFVGLFVIALHAVSALTRRTRNQWAYLFLLPVAAVVLAEILYANSVVRVLGAFIAAFSLAFFSYWLTAGRSPFQEVANLWTHDLVLETVLPFEGSSGISQHLSWGRHGSHIGTGIAVAIPFLLIIGSLFASADPLFRKVIAQIIDIDSLPLTLFRLIRDVIVAGYLVRLVWGSVTRAVEGRKPVPHPWTFSLNRVTVSTFLILLNILFAVFLAFQFIYFFGGNDYIQRQGLVYAAYARQGFFQLLFVAGLVFVLSSFLYRFTEFRDRLTSWLAGALILQTGVVIASAVKRMVHYIGAYGLTVSRWWAVAVILFIAAVLLLILVGMAARATYATVAKLFMLGTLIVFSALLLVNVEGTVVRWNGERFLSGKTDRLDMTYFNCLSSDAIPAVVALARSEWPAVPASADRSYACYTSTVILTKESLIAHLQDVKIALSERAAKDWRNAVISDYRALAAIEPLDSPPNTRK